MNIRFEYIGSLITFLEKIEALNLSPHDEISLNAYGIEDEKIGALLIRKGKRSISILLNTMKDKKFLDFGISCSKCATKFCADDIQINVCEDCGSALRKEDEYVEE